MARQIRSGKQVWICDICHRQIQVRKQISIRDNMIEHWVHLRCAGIRLAQYTYSWTCHQHKKHRLNTTPPSKTLAQAAHPLPLHHHRNHNTDTYPTSPCSSRIGKAQTQSSHPQHLPPRPELNTYHTLPHTSLTALLSRTSPALDKHMNHVYHPYTHSPQPHLPRTPYQIDR